MAKKSGVGLGALASPNLNKHLNQTFTHGRVKFAITNSTTYPDSFKKFGEWATIGAIFFEDINNPQSNPNSTANTIAYPLNPNSLNIPLTNEIVYIVKLPNSQIQGNVNSFSYYYFNPLNIWNSAHHNAIPDGIYADTIPESQQQDYIQTEAGIVRRVTDGSTEINLGETFKESLEVRNLQPFEGDVIYQGRWGSSIRFGSTVINSSPSNPWSNSGVDGDPITIIRNGQHEDDRDPWIPQVEDINGDKSSIYLTSTQQILLEASSKIYSSYFNAPTPLNQFNGEQIILNSGRIVLNSKTDSILLSSFDTINLNSLNSVNIDTPKTIVASPEIYLGDKNATEPVILGDTFLDDLNKLLVSLVSLSNALTTPIASPGPGPLNGAITAPATDTVIKAQNMLNRIENYKSKVSKSK
ncbi:MAG: hypothetical protein GY936_14850 [Ignavibacteriae bacterium]|nr:hypothetical protein [Ignavibacteriota bacterium]